MTFLNALWSPYVYRLERHIWVCTDNSGQQVEQLYATEMSCVTAKTAKLQNWGGGGVQLERVLLMAFEWTSPPEQVYDQWIKCLGLLPHVERTLPSAGFSQSSALWHRVMMW